MTNAEKFKEVFGLEIDDFPADPCDIVDHNVCVDHDCYNCPLHNFWTKDWRNSKYKTTEVLNGNDTIISN